MSRSFLTPINLNQFELQNAVHQNLATAPSSAKPGQAYYSTSLNTLLVYNGTAWVPTTYSAGNGLQLSSGTFSALVVAAGGVLAGASGLAVDATVVTRKYAATIGDGSSTSFTVTHGLGTLDVAVQGYLLSSGASVEFDVARGSANAVTVGFASAPAASAIRVLVQG